MQRILKNVNEMRKRIEAKKGFETLTESKRKEFVKDHYGFLKSVLSALQERAVLGRNGSSITAPTVTRTWYGDFRRPNPEIVAELERQYRAACHAASQFAA